MTVPACCMANQNPETGSCEKVYLSRSGNKPEQFNNELQIILQEDIRLPGCHEMTTGNLADKLHIDSPYKGLVISHRIKVRSHD